MLGVPFRVLVDNRLAELSAGTTGASRILRSFLGLNPLLQYFASI